MTVMRFTELRRTGAGVLEDTPVVFEWDSDSHTAMQDDWIFELQVNTVREMPAGAEQPVEQVLSKEWVPFEIHGEWKDKWAGKNFAQTTYLEFARMVSRTPLVRWELGMHSMVGLLTKLRLRNRTDFEWGWAVTFSPHRNEEVGDARKRPNAAPVAKPIVQRLTEIQDAIATISQQTQLVAATPTGLEDLDNSVAQLGNVNQAFAQAQGASQAVGVDSGQQTLMSATDQIDAAQLKLGAMASGFRGCATAATTMAVAVGALSSFSTIPYDDPITMLRFEEYTRNTYIEATRIGALARAGESEARARMARNPRALYRTKLNDSLERIAIRFYGTADAWKLIFDANNLHTIYLTPGVDLIIPERAV